VACAGEAFSQTPLRTGGLLTPRTYAALKAVILSELASREFECVTCRFRFEEIERGKIHELIAVL